MRSMTGLVTGELPAMVSSWKMTTVISIGGRVYPMQFSPNIFPHKTFLLVEDRKIVMIIENGSQMGTDYDKQYDDNKQ